MKIDNMREEHQERLIKDAEKVAAQQEEEKKNEPRKDYGFVAISVGEGLDEIFKGLEWLYYFRWSDNESKHRRYFRGSW